MPEEIQQLKDRVRFLETTLFILVKSDKYYFSKLISLADGCNIVASSGTGSKIGTAVGQKLGFWNATPAIQQTNGVNLTNNVTSGGSNDTIADFSVTTSQASSGSDTVNIATVPKKSDVDTAFSIIRNDVHQLARKLKIVNDALRVIGLMS